MTGITKHASAPLSADAPAERADREHPAADHRLAGVPEWIAARVPNWIADGVDEAALLAALRGLPPGQSPGSPGWVGHFSAIGAAQARVGETAEATGDTSGAKEGYLNAAFYAFLARFPHFIAPDAAPARAAYHAHQAAYLKAARYFDPPLQVVRLPFEGGAIVGYLRIPTIPAAALPPVVVLSGGIDYWKSDSELHTISEALLGAGLATFAMDMPGTGESPLANGPAAERVYNAAIAHLNGRTDVAGDRLGVYGLSFGGHWAVKLALTNPRVRAAVNVSGPIHHAFTPEWCAGIAPGTLATLAATLGHGLADLGGPAGLARTLAPLSLVEQGVLRPRSDRPALLSIAGGHDEAVPLADLRVITDAGVDQDTLIFADDRHVASGHRALHLPFAARWLQAHLQP